MKQNFFAVDLGASSGRTILGTLGDDSLSLKEINRFPNHLIGTGGHFYWDIYELYRNIIEGLRLVAASGERISSIGIDTWGVDFVCVGRDGGLLRLPYSYRDPHTAGAPEKFFERVPLGEVYGKTGIQVMNFNSLFQLDTMRRHGDSALEAADKILFMPNALAYMLTGEMVTEYTIASTSQMLDARVRRFDPSLLEAVGLSEENFGRFVFPGEKIGELSVEVQKLTGLGPVPVIAVAGHDTASAVAAVPATDPDFAYLSSGTWSLMGLETKAPIINADSQALNFTNEGGVEGTIRFLKNICGMWLLERCRPKWPDADYGRLIDEARAAEPFRSMINPDDEAFANPDDMESAIRNYCSGTGQPVPETRGQIVRCIFESL
ncbi:MAG: rhamnulokinase, partial [Bacteroidales bacterium]|nr:rhamnulokinase [Bacteroidales bacterium]